MPDGEHVEVVTISVTTLPSILSPVSTSLVVLLVSPSITFLVLMYFALQRGQRVVVIYKKLTERFFIVNSQAKHEQRSKNPIILPTIFIS
jgi:hypothetical protein